MVYIIMENAAPWLRSPLPSALRELAARMLGITHSRNNRFDDSSTDPGRSGVARVEPRGPGLVQDAGRKGIAVDGSHGSDEALDQVLAHFKAPIVLSHTGAGTIHDHARNIDEATIGKLAAKGGVPHLTASGAYGCPPRRSPHSSKHIPRCGTGSGR